MVAEIRGTEDWRRPGCDDRCQLVRAIAPGMTGRVRIESHDPDAHEAYAEQRVTERYARDIFESGPLVIDLARFEIRVGDDVVATTTIQTKLLVALAQKAGAVSSYEYLICEVWGSSYLIGGRSAYVHLVRVHMARLRSKLRDAGNLISTVTGMGYRLEVILPGGITPLSRLIRRTAARTSTGRWSVAYERCICCGSDARPHQSHGRCTRCAGSPHKKPPRWHYGPCQMPPSEAAPQIQDGAL